MVKSSQLAFTGMLTSLVGIFSALMSHSWLTAVWAASSLGWAYMAYQLAKQKEEG